MTTDSESLPAEILELLDGDNLDERTELVFELLTVAPSGWPHVALLSVGEVVALGDDELGLALWPASTTTNNLLGSGKAVLQVYHGGAAYRVRLEVRVIDAAGGNSSLALFAARVEGAVRDAVNYARLTSGPTIELTDIQRSTARWRVQIDTIRRVAAGRA